LCTKAARSGLALVAISETERRQMRHQPRRSPHRAFAGLMVRNRHRAERVAHQRRRNELFTTGKNRGCITGQTSKGGVMGYSAENHYSLLQYSFNPVAPVAA